MADWKGSPVVIHVFAKEGNVEETTEPVDSVATFLDTDTMPDIFERYPPDAHQYSIETEAKP